VRALQTSAIFMLIGAVPAFGQDYDTTEKYAGKYACIAEASGGVAFDESTQRWSGTRFDYRDQNFSLSMKPMSREDAKLLYKGEGDAPSQYSAAYETQNGEISDFCKEASVIKNTEVLSNYTTVSANGVMVCKISIEQRLRINLETRRFMLITDTGYIGKSTSETPNMTVGTCMKVD
jgi:hypothetical protein